MMVARSARLILLLVGMILVSGCVPPAPASTGGITNLKKYTVVAAESFLADIAKNVAGERIEITSLVPVGLDPHNFEPSPQDLVRLSTCDLILINGAGFESWLESSIPLDELGSERIVEASIGITPHTSGGEADPHFWLDPNLVKQYVRNIETAFSKLDPAGADSYHTNAAVYLNQLIELDNWIRQQVGRIPLDKRVLVTNHESLGYFAGRYDFRLAGSLVASPSSEASPSARQIVMLIKDIQAENVHAVFVESGANTQLADQLASETGITVVNDLFTHSLTDTSGPAPTYLEMMRYNVNQIVTALQ